MGDFEEKLNSILSSPQDMEKIMNMAKELSGSLGTTGQTGTGNSSGADTAVQPTLSAIPGLDALGGLGGLGGLDPKLLKIAGKLMGEYSSHQSEKEALFSAIKPYLKQQRRADLDNALKVAKLARIAKLAFSEFSGGDND